MEGKISKNIIGYYGEVSIVSALDPDAKFANFVEREFYPVFSDEAGTGQHNPLCQVKFVEKIDIPPGAIYVGRQYALLDHSVFLSLSPHRCKIDWDRDDNKWEITAERGIDPVRFVGYVIEPLARIAALYQNIGFIHAMSRLIKGRGMVIAAWGYTGKTNLVLDTLSIGEIFADDWSITLEGGFMSLNPRPVHIYPYNLGLFPEHKKLLVTKARVGITLWRPLEKCLAGKWIASFPLLMRTIETAIKGLYVMCRIEMQTERPQQVKEKISNIYLLLRKNISTIGIREISLEDLILKTCSCFLEENKHYFDLLAAATFANSHLNWPGRREISKHYETCLKNNLRTVKIAEITIPEAQSKERRTWEQVTSLIMAGC